MAKTLVYEMDPHTWSDLTEMKNHLHRIAKLGVDYVWLCPMYPSPGFDHGYDVADYKAIDPRIGTMKDFDSFVETAHFLGIGVLMDLVLNHTSIGHPWFREKPGYYCWSAADHPEWHNLFDDGPAWEKYCSCDSDEENERGYYLHLFHKTQADLNWFPAGELNQDLMHEFRDIVNFWLQEHKVDGFRVDFPQGLNKDLDADSLDIDGLLWGSGMDEVIDGIFTNDVKTITGKKPFLIAELFDPTPISIIRNCTLGLPHIDFFMNPLVKSAILEENGQDLLADCLEASADNSKFMLDLESHDSPRFTSISEMSTRQIFDLMFDSGAKGVCLYQGQELGTTNPIWCQMTDEDMLELDAVTAMRHQRGDNLHNLRKTSRANARVRISLTDYACQEGLRGSVLEDCKAKIKAWKSGS